MSIEKELEKLVISIGKARLDAMRFDNENIAAGVRIRKKLQMFRSHCVEIRKMIQKRRKKIKEKRLARKNENTRN